MNGVRFTLAPVPPELQFPDRESDLPAAVAPAVKPHRRLAAVRADLGRWWVRTVDPPALDVWWQGRVPHRVPEDNSRLRAAWRVDFAVTGSLLAAVSVALFLTAAGTRWVACHPARRWLFLALSAATAGLWLA